MEVESVNRAHRIVNVSSSHEQGVFVGNSSSDSPVQRAVGSIVELHIPSTDDFDALEAGDKEALAKYLVPDEERPGRYALANGCFGWMSDLNSSIRVVGELVEYVPFAESTEHLETV